MTETISGVQTTSFAEMPISEKVQRAVADQGWETPTPIQALALPELLRGEDVVGLAQTGSGKTAAFAIPLIESLDRKPRGVQALVLVPTRELAAQAAAEISGLSRYGPVRPVVLCGGVGIGPQIKALKNRSTSVVVGTPGRILDHLQRGTLRLGLAAVQEGGPVSGLLQLAVQLGGAVLGAAEDYGHGVPLRVDEGAQGAGLVPAVHLVVDLLHGVDRGGLGLDGQVARGAHVALDHAPDLRRHRRREEGGLPLPLGGVGEDAPDVRGEAHVEHPVGLVEHEIAHGVQAQGAALEVVQDAPWRAYDY